MSTEHPGLIFTPTVTFGVGQDESGWPQQQGVASHGQPPGECEPPGECAHSRALHCGHGHPDSGYSLQSKMSGSSPLLQA